VLLDRDEVLAAGRHLDLVARAGEERGDGAADSSRSDDANTHGQILGLLPARGDLDVVTGTREEGGQRPADRPRSEHRDAHAPEPS
jgi:hypothetical protein